VEALLVVLALLQGLGDPVGESLFALST